MSSPMHLIHVEPTPNRFIAYCGHKQYSDVYMVRTPDHPSLCSKCSSKYYAQQCAKLPYRLGERLNLADDERRYDYKSIYKVFDAKASVIGFVTIANGWGKAWEVHAWET